MLYRSTYISRYLLSTLPKIPLEDDYEIIGQLGQGSTSKVFKGINILDGHPVVIKIFKKMKQQKLQRELSVLKAIQECPYSIPMETHFRARGSGVQVLIMKYFEGEPLRTQMKGLPLDKIKKYVSDILRALDYMHNLGVMHRDVKPGNVLVCENAGPKEAKCRLFDMGLAEFYKKGEKYRTSVGTKCYKPPEILLKNTNYTPKLDIWCTGLILAEMLTNTKPIFPHEDDQVRMLRKVLKRCRGAYQVLPMEQKEIIGKVPFEKLPISSVSIEGSELVEQMMNASAEQRPTPSEALNHPFFKTK